MTCSSQRTHHTKASSLRSSMARHRSGLSFRQSLVLAVMAAACAPSSEQQQPPALPSCPPVQVSLSPCVSYFIGNSSSPSDACCSKILTMLLSQAPCLCAAVAAAPSQLGLVLGQAQALLPSSCNLPLNACTDVTGTSPAPAGGSTAPSSGTTAAAADAPVSGPSGTVPAAPSGGGLKSVPALLGSAAAGRHGGISAAAILISFLVAYVF